jgi:hypothetical protein
MTLGRLKDEKPEPMTREQFEVARKRIHASWNGDVFIQRETAQALVDEILWLKKRLRRAEYVLEPMVEIVRAIRRLQRDSMDTAAVNRESIGQRRFTA